MSQGPPNVGCCVINARKLSQERRSCSESRSIVDLWPAQNGSFISICAGHAGDLLHSVFCSYLMGSVQGREGGLLIPRGHANSCRTPSTLIPLFPLLIFSLSLFPFLTALVHALVSLHHAYDFVSHNLLQSYITERYHWVVILLTLFKVSPASWVNLMCK